MLLTCIGIRKDSIIFKIWGFVFVTYHLFYFALKLFLYLTRYIWPLSIISRFDTDCTMIFYRTKYNPVCISLTIERKCWENKGLSSLSILFFFSFTVDCFVDRFSFKAFVLNAKPVPPGTINLFAFANRSIVPGKA